ncbi:MAG: ankyrin repeat domain-containing protein, partial [Elusimicrobiaceae bacterium]|nr:ankyrin repeat domain-containing protein [Elusimicrobiaceae bacterium]
EQGNIEAVELLIKAGADKDKVTFIEENALIKASEEGHKEIVKILLDEGAFPGIIYRGKGKSPLIIAASNGNIEIVKMLLGAGANVNEKNWYGETALNKAKKKGHTEIADLLKAAGAKE